MPSDTNLFDWIARGNPRTWNAYPSTIRRLQATRRQAMRLGEPRFPHGQDLRDLARLMNSDHSRPE